MKNSFARKSSKRANRRVRYDDDPSRILELELKLKLGRKSILIRACPFSILIDPPPTSTKKPPRKNPKEKNSPPSVLSLSLYLFPSRPPIPPGGNVKMNPLEKKTLFPHV